MPVARKTVVDVDQIGVYHCISRCVRRAFLCGIDAYTGANYEHRRAWITESLKTLTSIFAIEVLAYSVMSNHLHLVVRNRPDQASVWTPAEDAQRRCHLFPQPNGQGAAEAPSAVAISAFVANPERREWFSSCLSKGACATFQISIN